MKLKVESRILYRLQFVMHVLNCPLKLYLTNSHRHLDLLCLLIDPRFPNDSFKQKNSCVFYIPKKRQVLGILKNQMLTYCKRYAALNRFIKVGGFMLLCIGQPFCFGRISFDEITFHYIYGCSKRHLSSS